MILAAAAFSLFLNDLSCFRFFSCPDVMLAAAASCLCQVDVSRSLRSLPLCVSFFTARHLCWIIFQLSRRDARGCGFFIISWMIFLFQIFQLSKRYARGCGFLSLSGRCEPFASLSTLVCFFFHSHIFHSHIFNSAVFFFLFSQSYFSQSYF
jgi:hypothetical protein